MKGIGCSFTSLMAVQLSLPLALSSSNDPLAIVTICIGLSLHAEKSFTRTTDAIKINLFAIYISLLLQFLVTVLWRTPCAPLLKIYTKSLHYPCSLVIRIGCKRTAAIIKLPVILLPGQLPSPGNKLTALLCVWEIDSVAMRLSQMM